MCVKTRIRTVTLVSTIICITLFCLGNKICRAYFHFFHFLKQGHNKGFTNHVNINETDGVAKGERARELRVKTRWLILGSRHLPEKPKLQNPNRRQRFKPPDESLINSYTKIKHITRNKITTMKYIIMLHKEPK